MIQLRWLMCSAVLSLTVLGGAGCGTGTDEETASEVPVQNDVALLPEAEAKAMEERLLKALKAEPKLKKAAIKVDARQRKLITLTGTVEKEEDKDLASEIVMKAEPTIAEVRMDLTIK